MGAKKPLSKILGEHTREGVLVLNLEGISNVSDYILQLRDDLLELGYNVSKHLVDKDDSRIHHISYVRGDSHA